MSVPFCSKHFAALLGTEHTNQRVEGGGWGGGAPLPPTPPPGGIIGAPAQKGLTTGLVNLIPASLYIRYPESYIRISSILYLTCISIRSLVEGSLHVISRLQNLTLGPICICMSLYGVGSPLVDNGLYLVSNEHRHNYI